MRRTVVVTASGDDGNRTHDLLLAKQALYQLSYVPAGRRELYRQKGFRRGAVQFLHDFAPKSASVVAAGEVGADQSDGAARDGECVDLFVADDGAEGKCNDGD